MRHYYFNLTDGRRLYPDPLGMCLLDADAARQHALEDARSLLESWMVRSPSPWRIEVRDDSDSLICSVSLAEAAVSEARPLFQQDDETRQFEQHLLEGTF